MKIKMKGMKKLYIAFNIYMWVHPNRRINERFMFAFFCYLFFKWTLFSFFYWYVILFYDYFFVELLISKKYLR